MIARAVRGRLPGFLLVAALGLAGCGGDRYIVVGTAKAPSVSGWVLIADAGSHSAEVTVHLEQLHPASQLDAALHAYVVWFEPPAGAPLRAGSLKYLPDERVGELRVKSPFGKFVVKVTAEANDTPTTPGELLVASQDVTLAD